MGIVTIDGYFQENADMNERVLTIRKAITFVFVSSLLLAIAFAILDFSGDFTQNALSGAIVGAISGLVICATVCVFENKLMPQVDYRYFRTGIVPNAIVGGYIGLIVTSVLITITFTIVGLINHLPDPYRWGTLISALAGWLLGALMGAIIGASWRLL